MDSGRPVKRTCSPVADPIKFSAPFFWVQKRPHSQFLSCAASLLVFHNQRARLSQLVSQPTTRTDASGGDNGRPQISTGSSAGHWLNPERSTLWKTNLRVQRALLAATNLRNGSHFAPGQGRAHGKGVRPEWRAHRARLHFTYSRVCTASLPVFQNQKADASVDETKSCACPT
jgi:hypothetical protein